MAKDRIHREDGVIKTELRESFTTFSESGVLRQRVLRVFGSTSSDVSGNAMFKYKINSTGHLNTQSVILSLYFDLFYLMDKRCFESASFSKLLEREWPLW